MASMAPADVIDALYAALRAGDTDGVVALLSDDVVMVVPGPDGVGASGEWRGHDGARECFRRLGEGHVTERLEFLERVAEGPYVVSRLHVVAVARATGRRFESDIVHLFTVRDGKVTRLLDFFDTAALVTAYLGDA
jgi:ketosteroid isomerase-like protein